MPAIITDGAVNQSVGRTLEQTISPGQTTDWVKLGGFISVQVAGVFDPSMTGLKLFVERSPRNPGADGTGASTARAVTADILGDRLLTRGSVTTVTEAGAAWYRFNYPAGAGGAETVFITGKVAQ
jgi:hypothetical protein